jgi:hypothetical protein
LTALGLAVVSLLCGAAVARASTFSVACVGTTGDVTDLKSKITQANSDGGSNTLQLGAGCTYMLTAPDNYWYGPDGLPPIASDITIEGNGATITRSSSAPKFRLFFVAADQANTRTAGYVGPPTQLGVGGRLTLRDLTLSGGVAKGGDSNLGGGGAGMGGAIFSQGDVTIVDSTLTANTAQGGSSGSAAAGDGGGGIGTDAPSDTTNGGGGFGPGPFSGGVGGAGAAGGGGGGAGFVASENGNPASASAAGSGGGQTTGLGGNGASANTPGASGGDGGGGGGGARGMPGGADGGGFGQGGGGHCDLGGGGGGVGGGGGCGSGGGGFGGGGGGPNGGNGGFGGGAGHLGGPGFGGGSYFDVRGGGGAAMGGAIFNMQGTLTINNSTLAANSAIGGNLNDPDPGKGIGGAVFNLNGTVTTSDSTFALNLGTHYAAQIYNLDYDNKPYNAITTLKDTIVAYGLGGATNDVASDQSTDNVTPPTGASAVLHAGEFDLLTSVVLKQEQGQADGSSLLADPMLGPLRNNGGPTETMAPMPGSPAIDAGTAEGLTTDQRGAARPVDFSGVVNAAGGDGSDIGAVELQQACIGQTFPSQACHTLALRLVRNGKGKGKVNGTGIRCPGTCANSYADGTVVTLTATPARGSRFSRWSGACTGSGTCTLAITADQSVTATFSVAPRVLISSRIDRKHRTATFKFRASGATAFRCALVKSPKKKHKLKPRFARCNSPRTYKHLNTGKYTFEVRALLNGVAGPAVARRFSI